LAGIALRGDLSGWNFAGQNLANARFFNLGRFCTGCAGSYATLNNADFSGADTRGARGLSLPSSATTANLICP
jgi:uncharacterized protein YjbI with pentapeptide repeats